MNSCCNSADSASRLKESCDSHVSIYYEQRQEEELVQQQLIYSPTSNLKISKDHPIEIHEEDTRSIELPPLSWHGYDNNPKILSVTNTGRTILINGHWVNSRPYLEGGPLNGNYLFSQIHFHCPSEHEIDGRRYPLEMHIVHYKTSYLTQERAMGERDGTVVLVYLFKLMDTRDPCCTAISQITKLAPQLERINSRTETADICLDQIIKPFYSNYYFYWGSVDDLSNIITSAGLCTVKQSTRIKPENDAIYHVGEDDYTLPALRRLSFDDINNFCRCHEVSFVACDCDWKKANAKDDDDGATRAVACKCTPKVRLCSCTCTIHRGQGICCRARYHEGGQTDIICLVHERFEEPQSKKSKKKKSKKKGKSKADDDECLISCESIDGSSQSCLLDDKSEKKKKKKSKKKGKSKADDDECLISCESMDGSSQSCLLDDKSEKKKKKKSKKKGKSKADDDECLMSCESMDGSSQSCLLDEKSEKKKKKKSKKQGKSKADDDECLISCESMDGSSQSCLLDEKSEKKKKKKSKKQGKSKADDDECVCESTNGSSQSSLFDDEPEKKKKKKKSKKKKRPDDCNSDCDSDCGKSSSKSSGNSGDQKTSKSEKKKGKKEKQAGRGSKCSVTFNAEDDPKRSKGKTGKCAENQEFPKGSDQESEDEKVDSKAERECRKKKKKNNVQIIGGYEQLNDNLCVEKQNMSIDLSNPKPNSNNPTAVGPSPSVREGNKNTTVATKDTQIPEPDVFLNCVVAPVERSCAENIKITTDTCEDDPEQYPGVVQLANSCTNILKLNTEVCEPEAPTDPKPKSSKSKFPLANLFRKTSTVKENEASETAKSKMSVRDGSQSQVGKNKKSPDCNVSQSVQEIKQPTPVVTPVNELPKPDSKSPGDKKKSNNKLDKPSKQVVFKSKEDVKGNKKANSSEQENSQDCKDDIMTLFEKKQVEKKVQPLGGDCNDVQINFLLTPCVRAKSNPSCAITASDSDFVEEKKISEDLQENASFFAQNFTVNTVAIQESEVPADTLKKESQVCLLMEHLFRTEKKGQVYKCSSQEYHLAIMYDQNVLQEYKGKFHPQELQLGNDEILQLVPKFPEPEHSNIRLQDCVVKKESLDQICIRVKFLLRELNFKRIFAEMENGLNKNDEVKAREVFDEETQYSCVELDTAEKLNSMSPIADEKIIECERTEILNSGSKAKSEEQQEQQPKISMLSDLKGIKESQKCTIKLEKTPNACSQGVPGPSEAEEDGKEANMTKDKSEKACSEKTDKKLKPLFVKRRKTVYFMYDKVEKDESTGKKVFVGSFRTKEEVDNLKKQKQGLEESEPINSSQKSIESSETKYGTSCTKKQADLQVIKPEQFPKRKESSPGKRCPSISKDSTSNKKNDVVTLHKYKPKCSGATRPKKDCKNVLIGKVVNNLQKDNENIKDFARIIGVKKEKNPKITFYELQEAKESKSQKEIPDPGSSKSENKSKAKNMSKATDQDAHSEVIVPEKSNKAEEDSAVDDSQKSLDKKESQAALILIPVEVESLSKIEVILIEHSDDIKKNKKEDEHNPSLNCNK